MKPHYSPILGLAYISLFAGSTLGHLTESEFWIIAGTPVILVGVAIMMVGMVRYIDSENLSTPARIILATLLKLLLSQ
jgi:hypothetical protein